MKELSMDRRNFMKAIGAASLYPYQHLLARGFSKDFSIAFGSCNKQYESQHFWRQISTTNPDVWFAIGDNIYADTKDKNIIQDKYDKLVSTKYSDFRNQIPVEGIWDDHDYGINNGNKNYKLKEISQELFLDFLQVPNSDIRRRRQGIYYSRRWTVNGKKIKAYFLDCRFFKDKPYQADSDILGMEQWGWLEDELYTNPGDINIFVSSIGVLVRKLQFTEDWDDYQLAKNRLYYLLDRYKPPGTFFLSGDKHFGTFIETKLKINSYPWELHEFQSSGLTHGLESILIKPLTKMYGPAQTLAGRNFGTIDFQIDPGLIQMNWTLHSIDNKEQAKKRSFILGKNQQWIKTEIVA